MDFEEHKRQLDRIEANQEKLMADFTKLNAAVTKLGNDVDALITADTTVVQPAIDAATAAVAAVDGKVVAATPAT